MPTSEISELLAAATAAAECAKLPEHVRSMAATVQHMARALAAEPCPSPSGLYALEQAVGILERWTADYDCTDNSLAPLRKRQGLQQAAPDLAAA